jgi:hypothetical protein
MDEELRRELSFNQLHQVAADVIGRDEEPLTIRLKCCFTQAGDQSNGISWAFLEISLVQLKLQRQQPRPFAKPADPADIFLSQPCLQKF